MQVENDGHERAKGLLRISEIYFGRKSVAEDQLVKEM